MAVGTAEQGKAGGLIEQALQTELPAELKEALHNGLKIKTMARLPKRAAVSTARKGKHDRKQFAAAD